MNTRPDETNERPAAGGDAGAAADPDVYPDECPRCGTYCDGAERGLWLSRDGSEYICSTCRLLNDGDENAEDA